MPILDWTGFLALRICMYSQLFGVNLTVRTGWFLARASCDRRLHRRAAVAVEVEVGGVNVEEACMSCIYIGEKSRRIHTLNYLSCCLTCNSKGILLFGESGTASKLFY